MFRVPLPFFLTGICLSLMLAQARAETSRNIPAEMGAALWLKADENLLCHPGGNGTVVATWRSKVGNLTATQSPTEMARIEGNQTIANNKDAIFFPKGHTNSEGYGYFEIPSSFNLKNSTVLVSLKYEGGAPSPRVLSFLATDWRYTDSRILDPDGVSNDALGLYHSGDKFEVKSNGSNSTSPTYTLGNWTVLSHRIDGNGNMTVALDRNLGTSISNPSMAAQNSAGKIHIGRPGLNQQAWQENLYNAYIYEIIIFNKYLKDEDYAKVQAYMRESMEAGAVQIDSLPTASSVNKGSLLSTSSLTGGSASSSGTAVTGNFSWTDNSASVQQSGNYSVTFQPSSAIYNSAIFDVPVIVNPELLVAPNSLTGFETLNGTASPSQSLSISGTNLISSITASISSDSGFEISKDNSTFGSNVIISVSSGNASGLLYARLAAQNAVGSKTASLNISSGAENKSVTLQGKVVAPSQILLTPEVLAGFVTTAGTPSASANFTVNASHLTGNLTANASSGFEIALGNGTFAQTLEISPTDGNVTATLNLRVAATASAGALNGSVMLTSGNASATLSANGTVNAPPAPAIIVTPGVLAGFVTTLGKASASKNFTVNASHLTGNLTASASGRFEIALGNGTFSKTLEISPTDGNVTATLNLRVAATASAGALNGSVMLTSGNASATLSANGTVSAPPSPTPTPTPPPPNADNEQKGKKYPKGKNNYLKEPEKKPKPKKKPEKKTKPKPKKKASSPSES